VFENSAAWIDDCYKPGCSKAVHSAANGFDFSWHRGETTVLGRKADGGQEPQGLDTYATRRARLNSQLPFRIQQAHVFQMSFRPNWAKGSSQIVLLRLEQNQGISAARNAAIARATSPLLACVNPEVLPDPDWVATCVDYLRARPQIGACYTRTVPDNTRGLLTRWRMRFQEPQFAEHTGPAAFAHGHAVFFRRAAVEAVGRLVQSGRELPGSSLSLPHQMDHHPCGKKCRQRPLLISANRYGSMGVRVVDRHRTHREAHFSRVITYRIRRG
jgi:glycosyltransferase involved in cell wall biosynthesis